MGLANDIIARADELKSHRVYFEKEWMDVVDFCQPSWSRTMRITNNVTRIDAMVDVPSTKFASRKRFDSTPIACADRLTAGMESLVTPHDEKWQENAPTDPLGKEPSDEERQWLERLRDYQFAIRYDPMSGFANVNQRYIRSIVLLGTGVMFIEEAFGGRAKDQKSLPFIYQFIPLSQAYIDVDVAGNPDTLYRIFSRTARQLVQKFGDKCSQKVRDAANNPKEADKTFEIIHAVFPRSEAGSRSAGIRGSAFQSVYVETEGPHLIGDSGFYEFPFAIGYWSQNDESPYGESPFMAALDDIRGLNVTRKSALTAWQKYVNPPVGIHHDGVMNRPNLSAGAINYKAIDGNGRPMIQPIHTVDNPGFSMEVLREGRDTVKELTYNNLFQILVQNPQMTAHEAMLRAAEKGDLLGPNGIRIQQGYSVASEREQSILERKGAFRPGASLAPPDSLRGRPFGARFTSPLDRLRQAKEVTATLQTYQFAGQIAALKQSNEVFDYLNDDVNLKLVARVNGMPLKGLNTSEQVEAERAARMQQQNAMMALSAAEQGSKAMKGAADAEKSASEAMATQAAMGGGSTAPLQLAPLPAIGMTP